MRIVVDTNIAFSAILHTNSKAARVILLPRTGYNFYSTRQLMDEIDEHSGKLMALSGYHFKEFERVKDIITRRIKFIEPELISASAWKKRRNSLLILIRTIVSL